MRRNLIFILALLFALGASAKKDRYTRVYMFGMATAFTDSVVVMTDIQSVDSAFVTANNLLPERSIYSYQLESFFEIRDGKPGVTVAVIWGTDRKLVEKDFLKLRRRFMNDKTTKLQPLTSEEFTFKKVEHYAE